MADNNTNFNHIVQRNLAYFWSLVGGGFLFYAATHWGEGHPEIQTLLIGFVLGGGVVGIILGTYFTTTNQTRPTTPAGTTTADISATVTTSPDNSTIPTDNAT